jgi:hypothetical protein
MRKLNDIAKSISSKESKGNPFIPELIDIISPECSKNKVDLS